ncbi:MAG: class II fructose-bisphosphate aldolase, partial [Candidatus Omnitrophica bacterium]|nr:class II fructose-bisphosphate aldolase [Candidatus Omnitrophota bacterium]
MLMGRRSERIVKKLGANSKICLLSSDIIFREIVDKKVIIMVCNTRIKHVIPGIMQAAKELGAIVGFELAKSEGGIDGGYTGQTPQIFFETIIDYAEKEKFYLPFFIHADHLQVKNTSTEEIESTRELIKAQIEAGYTSFGIDASLNEIPDNIKITAELAPMISATGSGLEVEVGEIKALSKGGELTTVEEASAFISELNRRNVQPNLLAVNNGSKHGNYASGEEVHIDLKRTGEIYEAIKSYKVSIAQHGITGTPLNLVGEFADYGIRKGNVGTLWQNIAHKYLPEELMERMKKWAEENNQDIKKATAVFKEEIDNVNEDCKEKIKKESLIQARAFMHAFRAKGTV